MSNEILSAISSSSGAYIAGVPSSWSIQGYNCRHIPLGDSHREFPVLHQLSTEMVIHSFAPLLINLRTSHIGGGAWESHKECRASSKQVNTERTHESKLM